MLKYCSTCWGKRRFEKVHPIAYAASSDPETLYQIEIMRQPDAKKFEKAAEEDNDLELYTPRHTYPSWSVVHALEAVNLHQWGV